ncbi:uncharacterized protein LOC125769022 [Anopheles funestus]|uniref:uncharacterized protein LOC125769022 n=1 Tax=Anopheles funestus TaxID=62324 RepID=UPI0020C704BC|nr:uncharacterized protein LOC125769022 [Anopheles funestus]
MSLSGFNTRYKREDSEQDLEAGPPLVFVRSVRGECAGILITENIIIASARCAYNNNSTVVIITKQNVRHVTFDGYNRQNELQLSHVITHPSYNETLGTHDIALLKFEKPIHVQNNVIPSCLWLEDETIPPKPMIAEWRNWKARKLTRKELKKIADSSNCIRYLQPMPPTYRKYDIADYHLCVLAKVNHLHPSALLGPLYTDLIYDGYIIPFVVGFNSVHLEGLYNLNIFVRVSKFVEWIKRTIHDLGEELPLFDPIACAKEYLDHHRRIKGSLPLEKNYSIKYMVQFQENPESGQISDCVGALIRKDMVITLGQCAANLIALYSRVVLSDSSKITIWSIFLHPDYTEGSLYNNIALVKLEKETLITPVTLTYDHEEDDVKLSLYGKQRTNNMGFEVSDGVPVRAQELSMLLNYQCNPTEEQAALLTKGLQLEHVCLQKDESLVPGSCVAEPGTPFVHADSSQFSPGLYMLGRHCGFGQPAIAVIFLAHEIWINSILDSLFQKSDILIISDVSDSMYPDGTSCKCVAPTRCSNINERVKKKLPIFFCMDRSIVCCPLESIEDEFTFAINRS